METLVAIVGDDPEFIRRQKICMNQIDIRPEQTLFGEALHRLRSRPVLCAGDVKRGHKPELASKPDICFGGSWREVGAADSECHRHQRVA